MLLVYFIVKGSVKLVNEDGDGIAKLLAGSYMGEIEVLDEVNILLSHNKVNVFHTK